MGRANVTQLSQLEQELEMELDSIEVGPLRSERRSAQREDVEQEADDEFETDEEFESDDEVDEELESILENERFNSYGDRLASLASREFEDERELELAVGEVLDDMEREFFFKGFKKLVSKAGKSLLKKGMALAGNTPFGQVFKGVTALARGNLKGMLGPLLKAGLSSVIPGGAVLAPMLSSLAGGVVKQLAGGEGEMEVDDEGQYHRLAEVAQTAFEELARNLNEKAVQPVEASRLAQNAIETAIRKVAGNAPVSHSSGAHPRTRHITLRAGERLVITRA